MRYTLHALGYKLKKRREIKAFPARRSAENLMFKRMKARNEETKKAKNYFLAASLDLFKHFSHQRALCLDSDTVETTHRISMVLYILNLSVTICIK